MRDCPPEFMVECLNVKIITREALGPNACSRGRLGIKRKKYSEASCMQVSLCNKKQAGSEVIEGIKQEITYK